MLNKSKQFAANVSGSSNTSVSWGIVPKGMGSVSANGLFLLPAAIPTQTTVVATATNSIVHSGVFQTVTVAGIAPTSGSVKFSVQAVPGFHSGGLLVAGDGYAYTPFTTRFIPGEACGYNCSVNHMQLLRVNSAGSSNTISVLDWTAQTADVLARPAMISNANTGVLISFPIDANTSYPATVSGSSVSVTMAASSFQSLRPLLQAQDGSYFAGNGTLTSFDGGGNVRWAVPNETPMIATADGGVIAQSGNKYDSNGNATGRLAFNSSQKQGWLSNVFGTTYSQGPSGVTLAQAPRVDYATTFTALQGGNASNQGNAIQQVIANPRTLVLGSRQLPNLAGAGCYPLSSWLSSNGPSFPTCGNVNAIELLTDKTPDFIFQNFIQTFSGAINTSNPANSVFTFGAAGGAPINVTAPGQFLQITLKGFDGVLLSIFNVMTERVDVANHVISVVTLAGHPLAGWRYWRVYSVGVNDVVIETGACDQPGPGVNVLDRLANYAGYYIAQGSQVKGWEDMLNNIRINLQSPPLGSTTRTSLGGIPLRPGYIGAGLLPGYWDRFGDFTNYILNNVCLSTVCN